MTESVTLFVVRLIDQSRICEEFEKSFVSSGIQVCDVCIGIQNNMHPNPSIHFYKWQIAMKDASNVRISNTPPNNHVMQGL